MSFIEITDPDLYAVAWDETVDPAVCVVVGELGTILYSVGLEYSGGFRIYTFERPIEVQTYNTIHDVDYGNGLFLASCAGGLVIGSDAGAVWTTRETGSSKRLNGITHVSRGIWVVVGQEGTVLRTVNNGLNWTEITNPANTDLNAVGFHDGILLGLGKNSELIVSTDEGLTWALQDVGLGDVGLNDLVWAYGGFFIVGTKSAVLKTTDGLNFDVISSPVEADFHGVAFSGALLVAVGADSSTITSTTGEVWDGQQAGIDGADFFGIGFGDDRFVVVGADTLVGYSSTGAARPAFDQFQPISDVYRAQCFTQFGAYMVYGGVQVFEGGEWNYYPRRILNPAPGTVDDFESQGWFFVDLPGSGYLLDMTSVRGGIVIAESNQLSLLSDAGSLSAPWMYHQNYGEGLKPISNLTSFNGIAYVVADDGLIYSATNTGVDRLPGFFDLTQYEDWEPGDESVWLGFDPIFQNLFVFRQKSPWTLWFVNDQNGSVSEMTLPELVVNGVSYEPRSVFAVEGLRDGIHVGYAAITGSIETMITAKLDLDGPITGQDEIVPGSISRQKANIVTGSFRLTALGGRGDINEVLVRTWADPDATVRPDIAVRVREECDDPWQTDDQPVGSIVVFNDSVYGEDTAWSRYIKRGATERVINVTVPKISFTPIDVDVVHNPEISVTVPAITFTPIDVDINTGTSIHVSVPTIKFTPIDCQVIYQPTINVTVPVLNFTAIDCFVDRGGFYELPWLVDQCAIYREDINGVRTLATYTKTGDRTIILATQLGSFESLYVNPGPARPFVKGRVGDYIFSEYGAHRITVVDTASGLELDWYPPVQVEGTYVPAQEIPEGGCGGDGSLVFGLGRGFDRLMIQVLIIPHGAVDAIGAKITGLELGYHPTGPEMKTDAGG